MHPSLSVVLPIYNEEDVAASIAARIASFAESHPHYEFLLVDDGSTDATPAVLSECLGQRTPPNVRFLAYAPNRGKGHAILFGFRHARGRFLCFTDGDLAYPLADLDRIATELERSDVVIGSRAACRASRGDPNLCRRFLGIAYNRLVRLFLSLPYRDTQAGLKGFRREAGERLFALVTATGFSFDVEVLFVARKLGLPIHEIPVEPEKGHSYKTGKVKLVRDSAAMLAELWRIRLRDWMGLYHEPSARTP
ncbi:Glycosyltransferase involved in cell wall bisynthesis [Methylacidimicrobium sp. AP8]|nr:Glycosyltransferase involved in cell wall bisynthesis [Methylacidimicrobium sp. AP8]